MSVKTKRVVLALFLSVFLIFPTAILANTYSSILAFGDSLSDNGYYQGYPGGTPGNINPLDIYGFQRFSNGPVWVEYLAGPSHLNVPLLDLAWVVLLRWQTGQPFYKGDTNHLSHRLVRRGLTKERAVLFIWVLAAVVGSLTLL